MKDTPTPCDIIHARLDDLVHDLNRRAATLPSLSEGGDDDRRWHLRHLAAALSEQRPEAFVQYVAWAKIATRGHGGTDEKLALEMGLLQQVLVDQLPEHVGQQACDYISAGLSQLPDMPTVLPSFLENGHPLDKVSRRYLKLLIEGDHEAAALLLRQEVEAGTPIREMFLHVCQPVQYEIGRLWQMGQITYAQEHCCTAATQMIMSQFYSEIFSVERNGRRMVATAVSGELHELGIRMVADFFEMEGWDTHFLGASTPEHEVLRAVRQKRPDILAISAMLNVHVRPVARLIAAVRADRTIASQTVLVGGYPFKKTPGLWRAVGADAMAIDAEDAVRVVTSLIDRPSVELDRVSRPA